MPCTLLLLFCAAYMRQSGFGFVQFESENVRSPTHSSWSPLTPDLSCQDALVSVVLFESTTLQRSQCRTSSKRSRLGSSLAKVRHTPHSLRAIVECCSRKTLLCKSLDPTVTNGRTAHQRLRLHSCVYFALLTKQDIVLMPYRDAEAAATHSDGSKKMKFSVCVKGLSPRTCWQVSTHCASTPTGTL